MEKKYDTFKEEISNYEHLNQNLYHEEIIPKAKVYLDSNIAKSMSAKANLRGIQIGTKINLENLISLILYCDYTELSGNFTATFRKKGPFEPLNQTKHRNSKYWHWSKILKETVDAFGADGAGGRWNSMTGQHQGKLKGPFYTGMSVVMNLPQFNIQLLSPTSTSVHLEVAMKFSGDSGMIIEFENKSGDGRYIKGFDCSWISRFKEEDERYDHSFLYQCN